MAQNTADENTVNEGMSNFNLGMTIAILSAICGGFAVGMSEPVTQGFATFGSIAFGFVALGTFICK